MVSYPTTMAYTETKHHSHRNMRWEKPFTHLMAVTKHREGKWGRGGGEHRQAWDQMASKYVTRDTLSPTRHHH